MKSSIDECIDHLIKCVGNKMEEYSDGTKVYEFRHRKKALIISSHILSKRVTHFVYQKGRGVYFSQSFDGKNFDSDRNNVTGWRKDVRNLAKTISKQEYLHGI